MIHLIDRQARELFGHHDNVQDLVIHADRIMKAAGQRLDLDRLTASIECALVMEQVAIERCLGLCQAEITIRKQWLQRQLVATREIRHGHAVSATH